MCQHFLDCAESGDRPRSCGSKGLEVVRILEASSESLKKAGAPVDFSAGECDVEETDSWSDSDRAVSEERIRA